MMLSTILGLLAGLLTTLATLPQLVKSWRTKETRDISIGWCILLISGTLLWSLYGLIIKDTPVIIANIVTLILMIGVLSLKIKYG